MKMDPQLLAKAAKRWSYVLHGNVCVSLMQDEDDVTIGLFISTPAGSRECYTPQEVNEFIDSCIASEYFNDTQH